MKFLRVIAAVLIGVGAVSGVLWADTPFTQFILNAPSISTPPPGDLVPIIDAGATKQTTVQALVNAGVASFNGRNGAVTLRASDLGALSALSCPTHQWFDAYSSAGAFTCAQPSFTDLNGVIAPAQLPPATTTSLGAIEAIASVAHEVVAFIDNAGVPHLVQQGFSDISGALACSQEPAFTGDATTVPGNCALTLAASGVSAGTYTNPSSITVDAKGRVTGATNGTVSAQVAIQGTFKNLHVYGGCSALTSGFCSSNSNTKSIITADAVMLSNGSGGYFAATSINCTIDYSTSGAGGLDTGTFTASTWYYDWVIYNGTTTSCLGSASSAAPTLPSGYTYEARVGAVRANSSTDLLGTIQAGLNVQLVNGGNGLSALPIMASGAAGNTSTPTWVAVAVGAYVPPTASAIDFGITTTVAGNAVIVAPDNSYGGTNSSSNPPPALAYTPTSGASATPGRFNLESTNIYWASSGAGVLTVRGWRDNL